MHFVIEFALGSGENIRLLSWEGVLERVQLWGGVANPSEELEEPLLLNSLPISEVLAAASNSQQPQLLGF